MISGIGTDLVDIRRIEKLYKKFGSKFAEKILTKNELKKFKEIDYLAKRFAAKEAIAKALGTGIGKVKFHDIEISNNKAGKPIVKIKNCKTQVHLSIADEPPYALAFAVAVG